MSGVRLTVVARLVENFLTGRVAPMLAVCKAPFSPSPEQSGPRY
jgi:hypothetical protein